MALSTFNVKYRLEFSNDETLDKYKIEILKDGYAGSVLSLVGTSNPVEIEWLRNDDVFTPLMGSVCNINIFQQDGDDYSEFYTSNEKEFLVYVYTHNGVSYDLFWKGWIIQEEYVETLNTPPNVLNLKAADMIASLGREKIYTSQQTENRITPFGVIKSYIDESGLEFDIVDVTDFKRTDVADYATSSVLTQYAAVAASLLADRDNRSVFVSFKDAVESVLKSFNARMFQSNGVLYIFNVQSHYYGSHKIHTYDYSAGTWSASDLSITQVDVPDDLLPMEQSLVRRYISPVQRYDRSYRATPRNLIYNGGFETGNTNGFTTSGSPTIVTDNKKTGTYSLYYSGVTNVNDATFDGASEATKNSTYTILSASTDPASAATHNIEFYEEVAGAVIDNGSRLQLILEFSYFINENRDDYVVRYSIEKDTTGTYFDVGSAPEDGVAFPTSGFQYKKITTNKVKQWNTERVLLNIALGSSLTTPTSQESFTLRIHSTDGPNTTDIYFDDFKLIANVRNPNTLDTTFNSETQFYNLSTDLGSLTPANTKQDSLLLGFTNTLTTGLIAATDELSGKILGAYLDDSTTDGIASKKADYFPKSATAGYTDRHLERWCMDQAYYLLNTTVRAYSGQFSKVNNLLTPYDSIVFNFVDDDDDQVHALTYLKLNLRKNRQEFETFSLSQLPNASAVTYTLNTEFSDVEFSNS